MNKSLELIGQKTKRYGELGREARVKKRRGKERREEITFTGIFILMCFIFILYIILGQGAGSVPDSEHRFEVIFLQSTLSEELITAQGFP